MKKRILHTIVLWAAALTCISCVKENFTPSQSGVGEARFLLDFGVKDDIAIQTKSTLDAKAESRVFNLYVFVFNSNGDKVTGEYFGSKNLKALGDLTEAYLSTQLERGFSTLDFYKSLLI